MDEFEKLTLTRIQSSLRKLLEEVRMMRDHYGKVHATEDSSVSYNDGVTHGIWTAYMIMEKQIAKILTES